MDGFQGDVTVTGTFTTSTLVITYGGAYANKSMFNDGYVLSIVECTIATSTPSLMVWSGTVTTLGVAGISTGSNYTIDFWAMYPAIANLFEGNLRVQY